MLEEIKLEVPAECLLPEVYQERERDRPVILPGIREARKCFSTGTCGSMKYLIKGTAITVRCKVWNEPV